MGIWIKLVYTVTAAKRLWRLLIDQPVQGHSNVRWYCTMEIMMQIARNFNQLPTFLTKLADDSIAPVLRPQLRDLYNRDTRTLKLQFAAMLDIISTVAITYELEGDGLPQLLAFSRVEGFRSLGRNLDSDAALRNVDAVLRQSTALTINTPIKKVWPDHGVCTGLITALDRADSTLYPDTERTVYTVTYNVDDTSEDLEEEEVRPLLDVSAQADRAAIVNGLTPGFQYLEDRLNGNCQANYSCAHMYKVLRLAQAFDPSFAAMSVTQPFVEEMWDIKPLAAHNLIPDMIKELPAYLVASASCTGFN
eukprot:1123033-Prymnesium_polylepis.1